MVIKLDFRKAIDSVSWSSLLSVLQSRGFPPLFCSWMHNILNTGETTILLNGVPRSWIQCRNGLRKGDPISLTRVEIGNVLDYGFWIRGRWCRMNSNVGIQTNKAKLDVY
jgi:hypothetical protein